jgi:hypothetical protein
MASNNVAVVRLADGREVCLSYGVIVAAFIPRGLTAGLLPHEQDADVLSIAGYVKTRERYSVTTSKHANAFAGKDAREVDDSILRALVSPVTDKRS